MRKRLLAIVTLGLVSGCMTASPVASMARLDTTVPNQCREHCDRLGMELGAVVIIVNATGCVCQPRGKTASTTGGASAAAGAAAIMAAQQAEDSRR